MIMFIPIVTQCKGKDVLVDVVREQRYVDEEREPLAREEEEQRDEGVRAAFWEHKLRGTAVSRVPPARGTTKARAHLVHFVTEVYRVDVVCL